MKLIVSRLQVKMAVGEWSLRMSLLYSYVADNSGILLRTELHEVRQIFILWTL
jgi:hypothetical protein